MKNFVILLFILALISCSKDDSSSDNNFLQRIESCVNDQPVVDVFNLTYDDQRLIAIEKINDFSTIKWEVKTQNGSINELTITADFNSQNTTSVTNYEVVYDNNQISLIPEDDTDNSYLITHTDNYVDTFRTNLGGNSNLVYEGIFQRNEADRIDSISYYANSQMDTILVYQYSFPTYITDFTLRDAFNPVYNYSFSFYEPYIASLLGVRISKNPPSKSSFLDGNGTFKEDNIVAQLAEVKGIQIQELVYSISDLPSNSYSLKFFYE